MLNMVTPDELIPDEDFNDILEDINEECGKYGEIEGKLAIMSQRKPSRSLVLTLEFLSGVRVPRPVKRDDKRWLPGVSASEARENAAKIDAEAGVGKVFVLYKDIDGVSHGLEHSLHTLC